MAGSELRSRSSPFRRRLRYVDVGRRGGVQAGMMRLRSRNARAPAGKRVELNGRNGVRLCLCEVKQLECGGPGRVVQ